MNWSYLDSVTALTAVLLVITTQLLLLSKYRLGLRRVTELQLAESRLSDEVTQPFPTLPEQYARFNIARRAAEARRRSPEDAELHVGLYDPARREQLNSAASCALR